MTIKETIETVLRDGFILVFNQNKLDVVKTAEAVLEAGVGNMEVTCRIRRPLEKIERLCKELPQMAVGAASMIDYPPMLDLYNKAHPDDQLPSVQQVIDAGASYLVSAANFSDATYDKFAGKLPIIPGCGSANEIVSQYSKGANFCKIFPANQLGGPGFVKAMDPAIHKTISLVPTGGTNADNIPDYIDAGILSVGASFSMLGKAMLDRVVKEENYDLLTQQLRRIKELIDRTRAKKYPNLDFATATVEEIAEASGRNFNIG